MDSRVFKEDFHTTDYLSTKGQARHRSIPKTKKNLFCKLRNCDLIWNFRLRA